MLIRVVKKGNRDMCAVSGLPASTEEWKRFDRIFEENVLELGFDEQKNEIYLVYMMTDAIESILVLEQAVMTGESFVARKIKADMILYSPLLRAADTAKHISDITGIPAREEMRLIEQNFGVWEGTSPRNSHEFYEAKKGFVQRFGSGESMFQLAQRIYNLLDELKADSDKTYILVAHNGIARIVCSYFKDMTNDEFAAYGVANCSITEFEF